MARRKDPLPKFEDWKAPWEEKGEEIDPDAVKKLVYGLLNDKQEFESKIAEQNTEIRELAEQVEAHGRENESEQEKLKRELAEAKAASSKVDPLETARLRVALRKGLTEKQAERLRGTTEDELEADADDYLEEVGTKAKPKDDEEEPKPDLRRQPRRIVNPLDAEVDKGPDLPARDQLNLIPRY